MNIYWGDIHNHCGITYGYGSLENALLAARGQLDFASVTGHAMWPDIPERSDKLSFLVDFHLRGFAKLKENWDTVLKLVNEANKPHEFVTFQSYEMHSRKLGDHHILSPDENLPLIYADSPFELVEKLKPIGSIAIPHHISYTPGYRGINWEYFDETISPVVEVYSKHGCSISDTSDWPYLHTMGPRDTRNTVYSGLKRGLKFGFTASTDHHAGYPGSYRDGRMAVYAKEKTRESIWDAIISKRTYAVSGDKIYCLFKINGEYPGSTVSDSSRNIELDIKARDFIDKVIIYKNAVPYHIINGELLSINSKNISRKYLIRVETGWGRNDTPYDWNIKVSSDNVKFISAESCFCGKSILAPSKDIEDDNNINLLNNRINEISKGYASWECTTFKNPSTLHSQTNAVILEVEGDLDGHIKFNINGKNIESSIRDLLDLNITGHMDSYNSEAYLIHKAVPDNLRSIKEFIRDDSHEKNNDFYHVEIKQTNGQMAWISPIYTK